MAQPTREHMKQDVAAYMRHYNQERFHSSNGDMSPVNFEKSQIEVSGLGRPEQYFLCKEDGRLSLGSKC